MYKFNVNKNILSDYNGYFRWNVERNYLCKNFNI